MKRLAAAVALAMVVAFPAVAGADSQYKSQICYTGAARVVVTGQNLASGTKTLPAGAVYIKVTYPNGSHSHYSRPSSSTTMARYAYTTLLYSTFSKGTGLYQVYVSHSQWWLEDHISLYCVN